MMAANDPYRELLMDGGLLNVQSDGAYMTRSPACRSRTR